ncbi:uncharacterized protein LOC118749823 [Rhagoletis pomonella]|uniref:uncharacterized protein LOC118749823 n=1 Tax=Rhagoletis pomonella TaxID=28610 RepID=UPI00178093A9|nr:uncharacterized protein LOC118749823 [Rhagoletis pomonella]
MEDNDLADNNGETHAAAPGSNAGSHAPASPIEATTRVDSLEQGKVKLPDFLDEHTDLWFWQVEAAFEAEGIVSDKKHYYTIIGQLPTRVMHKLADLRTNPRQRNEMYNTLKARIINEFADSTQTKITKVLSDLSLGDCKPSQLLAEMRSKAAATPVTDELLKQLWLRNLPEQFRPIISADDCITLVNAATMADRIMEATRGSNPYVNAVQQQSLKQGVVAHRDVSDKAARHIEELQRKIDALSRDLQKMKQPHRGRQLSSTPARPTSRTRYQHVLAPRQVWNGRPQVPVAVQIRPQC